MVIAQLAETYQQLYLDPDHTPADAYKAVVLKGDRPVSCSLSHFHMDERDKLESIDTSAGTAEVITLCDRHDFEMFIRCMMAAKHGPQYEVPPSMGASTIVAFNWPKIASHKQKFFEEQQAAGVLIPDWSAEFRRFTAVRENYQDLLIVLSRGPYSNVSEEQVNAVLAETEHGSLKQDEWIEKSDTIRKYHELTHFVCRKLYPDKIDEIWDELVADAVGIYAAFGEYDRELEELFLGIRAGKYTGGRLENYMGEGAVPEALAERISSILIEFSCVIQTAATRDVFSIMDALENHYEKISNIKN